MKEKVMYAAIRNKAVKPIIISNKTQLDKYIYDFIEEFGLDFIGIYKTKQKAEDMLTIDISMDKILTNKDLEVDLTKTETVLSADCLQFKSVDNLLSEYNDFYDSILVQKDGTALLEGKDSTKVNYLYYLIAQTVNNVNKLEDCLCLQ